MYSSDILPNYVRPCISERQNSIDSVWLNASDFGECYSTLQDSSQYPRLIPVYNGKVLDIESELLHASLSGISIKHYNGKCIKPVEDDILYADDTELNDCERVDDDKPESSEPLLPRKEPSTTSTESGSFSDRISWYDEGEPLCALPKINCRNSFWNIHQPEMCKLTWGQKYVSASTIIEHLHEHLTYHGHLCNEFHSEDNRNTMLNKELNEYVRLKVLLCPKEIPPDEPLYNFKDPPRTSSITSRQICKTRLAPQVVEAIAENERFISLSDDERTTGKTIHRSEEEFCVTIGKHVRQPPPIPQTLNTSLKESPIQPRFSYAEETEGDENFYYDWYLYSGEDYLGEYSDITESSEGTTITESDYSPKLEDKLSEFCRGVYKVDYSDIQCKPDF